MELPSFYAALKINLLYLAVSTFIWGLIFLFLRKKIGMGLFLFLICFTAGFFTWIHFYVAFQEATTYSPGFKSIDKFIGNLTAKISVAIYIILLIFYNLLRWLFSLMK